MDGTPAGRGHERLAWGRRAPRERTAHGVRRLRDLLRAGMVRAGTAGRRLPAESELMAAYGASRTTVRDALRLLRDEGLVARLQGRGTVTLDLPALMSLREYHGVEPPTPSSLLSGAIRSHVLEEAVVPAPAGLAALLGREPGDQVLCVDYVGVVGDEPVVVATDYVRMPEAAAVRDTPFRTDWYVRLADAGLVVEDTEILFEAGLADAFDAELLTLRPGEPIMIMEQLLRDGAGETFNVAVIRSAGRRMTLHSRQRRDRA
ncbi:GntR family transcriptional regulator [Pseudonocardia sp. NPDC049154]|uniref:GntR family transcriptional regulator n=1 Tax=Pseudonocardia sp. NPDC049154 TaxID=3155501 RepID=UPI0033E6F163